MARDSLTRYAWGVLAANLAVILWGAYVRATGSGAGCGSHWPLCNGEVLPRAPSVETLIELTHRVTSGVALLMVVALLVWARRARPKGDPTRTAAWWTMILMLGEAAIGAGIVLFELVAENASMARALFMATHLGNTFLLLGALTLTAYFAGGGAPVALAGRGRMLRLCGLALGATLLVGASGAVAALGDTLFPAASLAEALRQDLSPTSHILIQLRASHPLLAVLTSLFLLYFIGQVRQRFRGRRSEGTVAKRFAVRLNVMIFIQLFAGTLNIILLAPVAMQLLHLLLADLLWIVLVLTCAATLAAPATAPVPRAAAPEPATARVG